MKEENYDDYARIILEKFYPEALTKPMEIDNLMTKEYSRQKFTANVYPVLALTRESMMGDDNHYRCYKDSVIIDNISYYISSQWIEDSREDLINYYLERRNRSDNEQ